MHINRFMSTAVDAMSRTDRFSVEIRNEKVGIRSRGLRCTGINIPSKTMQVTRHGYGTGPDRPYVTGVEYENDVTCTFMLDSTYEDRQMMELWQSSMYDEAYNLQYPEYYHGEVVISQLGVDNIPIYTVKLHEAFPSVVGGITFSNDPAVQTFDVTFNYRTWSSSFENSPSGLLGGLFKKFSRKIQSKLDKKVNDKLFG